MLASILNFIHSINIDSSNTFLVHSRIKATGCPGKIKHSPNLARKFIFVIKEKLQS